MPITYMKHCTLPVMYANSVPIDIPDNATQEQIGTLVDLISQNLGDVESEWSDTTVTDENDEEVFSVS